MTETGQIRLWLALFDAGREDLMKAILYLLVLVMVGGGVLLVIGDFPMVEDRFPFVGPALIGFGLMAGLATFYIGRKDL